MPGADASRGRLIFKPESVFNETPAANPATTRIRFKSEGLRHKNVTVVSDEIRADLQRTDAMLVGYDVDGDISAEFSYGNFDWMLEAALGGTWTALTSVYADAVTNGTATVTSATAVFTADDLFKPVSGANIPANSYIGVINSATSFGLSSSPTANVPVIATGSGSGGALTIGSVGVPRASYLRNGVINRYFNIEKGFMDIAKFISYRGCAINTLALDVTSRRIVQIVAGIMGARGYASATSVAGSTTPTEPNSNTPISAGRLINLFASGGSNQELNGVATKEIKWNLNRNLRIRDQATENESDEFGRGAMDQSISMNGYFKDLDVYNAFIANQFFGLRFSLTDPIDNRLSYRFTFPTLKVTDANPPIGGIETDVMLPIAARTFVDPAVGYAIHVERGVTIIT